jgi:hypothetical protein
MVTLDIAARYAWCNLQAVLANGYRATLRRPIPAAPKLPYLHSLRAAIHQI